jgi:hypothetical protein
MGIIFLEQLEILLIYLFSLIAMLVQSIQQ